MDVICAMCGEPWEALGLRMDFKGDMSPWQVTMFYNAQGCPSCEGGDGQRTHLERFMRSVTSADADDRVAWILAGELPAIVAWEPPPAKCVNVCDGCGVSVVQDPDSGDWFWSGGKRWSPNADGWVMHDTYPAEKYRSRDTFIEVDAGKRYCPACVELCDACGEAPVFRQPELELGDSYAPGTGFVHPHDMRSCVCVDCFERITADDDDNDGNGDDNEDNDDNDDEA